MIPIWSGGLRKLVGSPAPILSVSPGVGEVAVQMTSLGIQFRSHRVWVFGLKNRTKSRVIVFAISPDRAHHESDAVRLSAGLHEKCLREKCKEKCAWRFFESVSTSAVYRINMQNSPGACRDSQLRVLAQTNTTIEQKARCDGKLAGRLSCLGTATWLISRTQDTRSCDGGIIMVLTGRVRVRTTTGGVVGNLNRSVD